MSVSKLALVVSACIACAGTLRDQVAQVSNGVADVANAGGQVVLAAYCRDQMRAIGRTGEWEGERCQESGGRAGSPATAEERQALAETRARWEPVLSAAERVASAHDALVHLLQVNDEASRRRLIPAAAAVAEAYEDLARVTRGTGLQLPALTGGDP